MLLRKLISFFFLFTLMVSMNFRFLVITDYCLNTQDYSKNCINKAKTKLNCSGMCQMNKKIAEVEKSAMANNQNSRTDIKKINLYNNNNSFILSLDLKLDSVAEEDSLLKKAIGPNFLSEIFRPPCA